MYGELPWMLHANEASYCCLRVYLYFNWLFMPDSGISLTILFLVLSLIFAKYESLISGVSSESHIF